MARLSRLAVSGCVHYLVQRGVDGRAVFTEESDFVLMLELLRAQARESRLAVHAYVLLPDGFHLLLTPAAGELLSAAMQAIGRRYVRRFNHQHGRTGALWEGRFRSTVLDPDGYLLEAMRLIETLPLREGLVPEAATYPWSSVGHHLGLRVDPLIEDHARFWSLGNTPFERQAAYARLCAAPPDSAVALEIRSAVHRGWPLGTPAFLDMLGRRTERRIAPRPVGRPRGSTQGTARPRETA